MYSIFQYSFIKLYNDTIGINYYLSPGWVMRKQLLIGD